MDDQPVHLWSAMTTDVRTADDYWSFVRELAQNVGAVERLLVAHVPDGNGMCRNCGLPGYGTRCTPWPCPVASVALMARDVRARKLTAVNGTRGSR